jgi:alginate O-acetyltransferase complex protein AlgI
LALIADQAFASPSEYSSVSLLIGAIAFSFQIYGDFSGYSDIALGTAKLFGFELLSNFRFPYFSRDIAEFWRRWHISLSSWFRDYLYIPLGGSKNGKLMAVRNTFIIFLVSGFWHGASWNFIAWGGIHAVGFLPLLLLNRNRANIGEVVAANSMLPTLKEFGQMLLTFTFVTFAWIFFRAESIGAISDYFKAIIQGIGNLHDFFTAEVKGEIALFYIIPFLAVEWYLRQDERRLVLPASVFLRSLVYLVVSILIFFNWGKNSSFIYFEF